MISIKAILYSVCFTLFKYISRWCPFICCFFLQILWKKTSNKVSWYICMLNVMSFLSSCWITKLNFKLFMKVSKTISWTKDETMFRIRQMVRHPGFKKFWTKWRILMWKAVLMRLHSSITTALEIVIAIIFSLQIRFMFQPHVLHSQVIQIAFKTVK